jgi:UDP-N-acetylmuramate dehydrogenase
MNLPEALRGLPGVRIATNESMAKHTTFKIGGAAEIFAQPENANACMEIMRLCAEHNAPVTIIGGGSNVLVRDEGVNGVVLHTGLMRQIKIHGSTITAEAGVGLTALAEAACKAGLSGLEFAAGIPGTAGGGVYMNAGAYGQSVSDVCETVTVLDGGGATVFSAKEMKFAYRRSMLQRKAMVALSASFALKPGKVNDIKACMKELLQKRKSTQPLEFPSAGSTFKRPAGYFAGKLIEDSRLKGFAVGGAQVSEKHAGFIVNTGGATANDVLRLIEHIKNVVYDNFNVKLECEIRVI